MRLAAGVKFDSYEILGTLGAGGMGEVYRARDSDLKREVAIKVLPAVVSRDPDRLRRFAQEAQAAAALACGTDWGGMEGWRDHSITGSLPRDGDTFTVPGPGRNPQRSGMR